MFTTRKSPSLGQDILLWMLSMLTTKAAANLQVAIPEKQPSLGEMKQGPLFPPEGLMQNREAEGIVFPRF